MKFVTFYLNYIFMYKYVFPLPLHLIFTKPTLQFHIALKDAIELTRFLEPFTFGASFNYIFNHTAKSVDVA